MDRRSFLSRGLFGIGIAAGGLSLAGCRGRQVAHVLDESQTDMVGSHEAGSETFGPLVSESVGKLLGREHEQIQLASHQSGSLGFAPKHVCFVGVENKAIEELGDFQEQLYQLIDAEIARSDAFQSISRRYVQAGLQLTRLRPDELFLPQNQREFAATLEQQGAPFDYLMFATLTSGTTTNNNDYQRDYLLTLELVDIRTGQLIKENAMIRKGYHRSRLGKWRNYNPFQG